jgi:serine/threonine protein kinase
MNIVVDGRYQIIKRLGKGGFAHTYLAKNLTLPGNPHYVLKQLRPQQSPHPWMLQLFQLEAKILARFDRERVPQPVEEFEHQGDFFFVQEFVAGDDLSKEFTIGHRWHEGKIITFLTEMLETIAHIHDRDAIHCDIKPNNIVRHWDSGKLVLIDFGAVRDISPNPDLPKNLEHPIVGTPGYRPPEQIRGEATYASDIYALGMTAIQFATGQYPAYLPLDERGQPIWRDLTAIDSDLADTIDRMVAPNPLDRYPDTTAVLDALTELPNSTFNENITATQLINRVRYPISGKSIAGLAICGMLAIGSCLYITHERSDPTNLDPSIPGRL